MVSFTAVAVVVDADEDGKWRSEGKVKLFHSVIITTATNFNY